MTICNVDLEITLLLWFSTQCVMRLPCLSHSTKQILGNWGLSSTLSSCHDLLQNPKYRKSDVLTISPVTLDNGIHLFILPNNECVIFIASSTHWILLYYSYVGALLQTITLCYLRSISLIINLLDSNYSCQIINILINIVISELAL